MTSGSGRMVRAPGPNHAWKVSGAIAIASTGSLGSSLDTRSPSRSFDPSTEVADFRDSKQKRT